MCVHTLLPSKGSSFSSKKWTQSRSYSPLNQTSSSSSLKSTEDWINISLTDDVYGPYGWPLDCFSLCHRADKCVLDITAVHVPPYWCSEEKHSIQSRNKRGGFMCVEVRVSWRMAEIIMVLGLFVCLFPSFYIDFYFSYSEWTFYNPDF